MTKQAQREIKSRLLTILDVTIFLVVTTWFWYGPREALLKKSEQARLSYAYIQDVNFVKDEKLITIDETTKAGVYTFSLQNNSQQVKDILIRFTEDYQKQTVDHCQSISYNHLVYQLKEAGDENFSEERNMSISGELLVATLQPGEEKHYILQYNVADNVNLLKQHLHGYLMMSNGQNI